MMVEVDDDFLDGYVAKELKERYEYFRECYENYVAGEDKFLAIFSTDKSEDMSKLLNMCRALELILDWYDVDVQPIEDSKLSFVVEKDDGSAIYNMNFSKEEENALLRLGVATALERGLEEAKKYHPKYEENKDE